MGLKWEIKWYHPECVGSWDAEYTHFEEFYCPDCLVANPSLKVTYKDVKNDCFRNDSIMVKMIHMLSK